MGKKSEYSFHLHPPWARSLARRDCTDVEMADAMGIARATLSRWKKEHPEFKEAIDTAKMASNAKVEDALFKRATGYEFEETKVIVDDKGKPVKIEKTKKHVPPETTACIFWLKNRDPEFWRDVHKLEHAGQVNHEHDTKQIEELLQNNPEAARVIENILIDSVCNSKKDSGT